MSFTIHLKYVLVRLTLVCSFLFVFGGISSGRTTDRVYATNDGSTGIENSVSGKIKLGSDNSANPNSSPFKREGAAHVLFGFATPESGVFPTDAFTVVDGAQKTGLRVNLPMPDCSVRMSDCWDLALIDKLDGFNLQPRVTIPFDGDINAASVNSTNVFFVELGDADVDATARPIGGGKPRVIGVNQLVWDQSTYVLAAESDEQLRQHTRYAFVVTSGVLDRYGNSVKAAEGLERIRHDMDNGQQSIVKFNAYSGALLDAFARLRKLGISGEHIAGLSVFTTQSATALLEHVRDQPEAAIPDPANFRLGPGHTRTVFSLKSIQHIAWMQQVKLHPPAFQPAKPLYKGETDPLLLLDQYESGVVGRIAYGSYSSPRYITDEPVMPAVGTRAGIPPVLRVDTIYVNVFLPAGTQPPKGWPVVIFGVGGGDYKEEMPWFYAAAFASHGIATACINMVGQAYGPDSYVKVTLKDGSTVQFPSGGRGKDLNGDGVIDDNEGVSTVSSAFKILGPRDAIRQQVIDLMQLVRVIEIGVDVDGDGIVDLDSSRISYFGISFGAGAIGHIFMAVEPDVKFGALASPGGMNSRFDLLRMRPAARPQVGEVLADRAPSLLNAPGLTTFGGVPVKAPFFNENIPLRNLPVVLNRVAGAMDIQQYFDDIAWVSASGDGAAYAPHIRKEPLAGMSPKSVLVNFGKGDESAANPRTTQLLRAGGYADTTTFYRNDLAYAEDDTVDKNPHTYLQRWMLAGLSGPIGRGGLEQVATYLASRGETIVHPEPFRFFEVPISRPLPEGFSYIP